VSRQASFQPTAQFGGITTAITSSSGRHRSRCASASSARQSSSAICSGVSSSSYSTNSFAMRSMTSRRSPSGRRRICSTISSALMESNLPYFASNFARTSSNETTSSGWFRWSRSRLSMSAASPGVSSFDAPISSNRLRHNSIRSARGSARASFMTDSELITSTLTPAPPFASP